MFIILLRPSGNKARAGEFMDGHKAWIGRGIDDGVFLLVGSPQPCAGGGILAHSMQALRERVNDDPFVAEDVVSAEVLAITPSMADERLSFLIDG